MRKKAYGTYDIAKICHVMPATIGRWIEEGKLPSFRTGGGHRRVWDADLAAFLKAHNIPIPPVLSAAGALSILIVDDEKPIRRTIRKILETNYKGAQLMEAEDGFEAGHKITHLAPALVLLDIKLPGLNGVKVCQTIREDANLKNVRILAMSGFNNEQTKAEVLEAGADDFIGKPFEPDELVQKINRLIRDDFEMSLPKSRGSK